MKTYVLDTSYILSLFAKTDANSPKAFEMWKEMGEDPKIIIPQIVVAELLIWKESAVIMRICRELVGTFEVNTDEDLSYVSRMPYLKRKTLKANDCLILSIVKRHSANLVTFDKKLAKYSSQ